MIENGRRLNWMQIGDQVWDVRNVYFYITLWYITSIIIHQFLVILSNRKHTFEKGTPETIYLSMSSVPIYTENSYFAAQKEQCRLKKWKFWFYLFALYCKITKSIQSRGHASWAQALGLDWSIEHCGVSGIYVLHGFI